MPAGVKYYLIYGYTDFDASGRPNHDGTISVESQLDDRAQKEATQLIGFNEDHTGILNSGDLIETIENLIADNRPQTSR